MVKNLPDKQEMQVQSLGGTIPWRRKWQPTRILAWKSLMGYTVPEDAKESDMT